jgi:hypothetical protein
MEQTIWCADLKPNADQIFFSFVENECPQILGVLAVFRYTEEPLATAMIPGSYAPLTSVIRIRDLVPF